MEKKIKDSIKKILNAGIPVILSFGFKPRNLFINLLTCHRNALKRKRQKINEPNLF
jgi:hypothetical protein